MNLTKIFMAKQFAGLAARLGLLLALLAILLGVAPVAAVQAGDTGPLLQDGAPPAGLSQQIFAVPDA